jgi:hypothetical protein
LAEKDDSEISAFLADLKRTCAHFGARLLEAEISEANGGAPFVTVFVEKTFLKIIELMAPRFVYFMTFEFDAKANLLHKARIDYEEIFDEPEETDEEEGGDTDINTLQDRAQAKAYAADQFLKDKKTRQFLKKWNHKNGVPFDMHAMFFSDGVYHEIKIMENWLIEYETERDAVLEQYKAFDTAARGVVERRLDQQSEQMAKQLAGHPLFMSKGATKEKREYLAQQLFPDQGYGVYARLVSRASSIIWYESNGGA